MNLLDQVGDEHANGLRLQGDKLATKLEASDQLTVFLLGLLARAKHVPNQLTAFESYLVEQRYGPAMTTAALRLLKRSPDHIVPLATIDTYLWLNRERHTVHSRVRDEEDLKNELCRTAARRQIVFWRAVEILRQHPRAQNNTITTPWMLEYLGWPGGLQLADLDWLLSDLRSRSSPDDRVLALSSAQWVWRDNGADTDALTKIRAAIQDYAELRGQLEAWLSHASESEDTKQQTAQIQTMKAKHAAEQAERDVSWQRFIAEMRTVPDQIRQLPPPEERGADSRLFSLWRLASSVCRRDDQYSFEDLSPIESFFGPELTAATAQALISFWRHWQPTLRTARPPHRQNQVSQIDCMAIAGISIEAKANPDWASKISDDDAHLATRYATLELNGFPTWLATLAKAKPSIVCQTLGEELYKELNETVDGPRLGVLERIRYADTAVAEAVSTALLREARQHIASPILSTIIDGLLAGLTGDSGGLVQLAVQRAQNEPDLEAAGLYIALTFAFDPSVATDTLQRRLDSLQPQDQTELALNVLPRLFGDHLLRSPAKNIPLPFQVLHQLVLLAFGIVRVEEDLNRPNGEVYSPTARDNAESARNRAFNALFETSGRATYDALLQLAEIPGFPVPPQRLRTLAHRRALADAENPPWAAAAVRAFEEEFEHAPLTTAELQHLIIRRLDDIQHDLIHSDFKQASAFKQLMDENQVQTWIADRLRLLQKKSYSVEREVHRADEKEPDIVVRAKASDASIPVEIKVAENWSLTKLEEAFVDQLCGRYLRAADGRHGIFLLAHQKPRAEGWRRSDTGEIVNFECVVDYLSQRAISIAGRDPNGPQPVIAVLDVSRELR
jgi:hypothetical protein